MSGAPVPARSLLIGLAAVLLAWAAVGLTAPADAGARIATGGTGRFAGAIDWIEWGTPFQPIPTGAPYTRSSTTTINGVDLVATCTLSNFGFGSIAPGAYRAGDWSGDALDDLYNIGGTDLNNQLVNGISGEVDLVTLDFACSATLGGAPFALDGVVFADAEQLNAAEYQQGTIPASATWRVIERVRTPGCTSSPPATRTADTTTTTLHMASDGTVCPSGPAVVAFADGATSGRIEILGGGKSAVALGMFVTFDHGDAPVGYGDAAHAVRYPLAGGEVPLGGPTSLFEPFALADVVAPATRLGGSVDPGGSPSADAGGDDGSATGTFGPGDDETEVGPAAIAVWPGTTHTRTQIACTGPGTVAGWIDFNANGSFDGAERSQSAPCTGSSVDLSWTVPGDARAQTTSFLRLRIAAAAGEVAGPTGVARSGEAEDHTLAIELVAPGTTITDPPPPPAPGAVATDLAVVNRVNRSAVSANKTITWTATVTNRGTGDATGVVLRAQPSLPVAFTLARTTTAGRCATRAPVRCELGTLAPGATATVTLIGRARVAGALRNTVRVSADQADPTPSNDAASALTNVRATLRLSATADRSSARAGQRVRYRIRVRNPSFVGVQRVRVCDRLPRGLVYVSSSRRRTRLRGQLCWNLGTVARLSSKTVQIVARARRDVADTRVNRATVSGRGAMPRSTR